MNESDRAELGTLLTQALAFYGQTLSPFALGVWWQACHGFDIAQVRKALTAHALDPDRGQFAPKPADLVRQLRGTQSDRGLIAWGKVMDAIKRVGAYQSVVFDDGAIHAAIVDIGGWPAVCRSREDELPFLQKRFCDLHRSYSGRPDFAYPARLSGDHEAQNALNGQRTSPPMYVGDPDKARSVAALGTAGSKTAITAGDAIPAVKRLGSAA